MNFNSLLPSLPSTRLAALADQQETVRVNSKPTESPSMLHHLPAELLDEILDLAAPSLPPERSTGREGERRKMLRAFSTICKAVGIRAQAVLWRQLDLNSLAQTTILTRLLKRKEPPEARKSVRIVRAKAPVSTAILKSVLALLTEVLEVQLVGLPASQADLSHLEVAVGAFSPTLLPPQEPADKRSLNRPFPPRSH
jgi:hypothetical protein